MTDEQSPQLEAPQVSHAKREVIEFIKMIVCFLVLFFTLKVCVVEGYEVQGESMEPTLVNNERILVFKLPHMLTRLSWFSDYRAIEEGDIVIFNSREEADKRYVKRVIARGAPKTGSSNTVVARTAGEAGPETPLVTIKIEDGRVFIDNKELDETYLADTVRERFHAEDYEVLQPGEYYVMGDNRAVSKDSRSFRAIQDEEIIGKAVLRFWPPSRISLLR